MEKETSLLASDENEEPDLVIECGEAMVDLSNLVSKQFPRQPLKRVPSNSSKPPVERKRRKKQSIYPTSLQANELGELNATEVLARCKRQVKKQQQTRMSPSMSLSSSSLPGAYATKPSAAAAMPKKLEHSNYSRHMEEHLNWVDNNCGDRHDYSSGGGYASAASAGGGYHGGGYNHNSSYYGGNSHASGYDRGGYGRGGYSNHHHHSPPRNNAPLQVEITPGVFAPLRGSDETWHAIEDGFSTRVDCILCTTSLLCIADADYVLCPECRVVSPTNTHELKLPPNHVGGVGLGLKASEQAPARASRAARYY